MERGAAVAARIILPGREAPIALPRRFGFLRVNPIKIGENGRDRGAQTVNVEPSKLRSRSWRKRVVMRAEPLHKVMNLDISPHPGREACEGLLG